MKPTCTPALTRLAGLALLLGTAALPAGAASSAASESSNSVSTSVGESSNSIQRSSQSSSGDDKKKLADGDYRIVEVADAAARPGTVRLTLKPLAADNKDGEVFLYMPQPAFEESRLAQGSVVTARGRSYGTEFSDTAAKRPFFLVLADEWFRDLKTKIVRL